MSKATTRKTWWQRTRKIFMNAHLWLGLSSGLIVFVICLSGTIYVFNTEITENASPQLYRVSYSPGSIRLPVDSLIKKVEAASGGKISSLSVPAAPDRTYQFNVIMKSDDKRSSIGYFLDPYTGAITGTTKDKNRGREFMGTMFSLHRWLLLDKIEKPIFNNITNRELGSMITGIATIIFTLGCITGLIIWFPQRIKSWKQGLKIKWNAGWKRTNHDLHNTLAFYALFFLLLMGLTGPQWSFGWYRTGMHKILGTYKPQDAPKEKPVQSAIPENKLSVPVLVIDDHIKTADKILAYDGNYSILLPSDSVATVTVSKSRTGFFAPAVSDRLTIDQYSGKILKSEIFREKPFNERISGSIKAIHVGTTYGMFSKIIYFLSCLIATSLPVTGTLIWLNKLKKRLKRKKKPALERNRIAVREQLA